VKILFLQKRPLFPADSGGKIRTLNVLKYLARWHEITYLCNMQAHERESLAPMQKLGLRLETLPWRETPRHSLRFYGELLANFFSPYPFNVNKDYDPALRERARQLLESEAYDLLICDFVQMARNAMGLPIEASILFEHNVEAQMFERQAQQERQALKRWLLAYQSRKMTAFEADAGRQFRTVIAVSPQDRQTFQQRYGWQNVEVIDTAVDVDFFQPGERAERPDHLVFLGSMDWLPNIDGVEFFVREIWPAIRVARPQATLQIVGRNPTPEVLRLGDIPGITVSGTVADVRPLVAEAAAVVVPLRMGGGTRIKIFEALALEKAVVSTPLGAEGLPVQHGEHLLLAESPERFAQCVIDLLESESLRRTLGATARRFVAAHFSAEAVAQQFSQICERTVAASPMQPSQLASLKP
jgi:glycosyltransferase involved in cell wall biosynthesis